MRLIKSSLLTALASDSGLAKSMAMVNSVGWGLKGGMDDNVVFWDGNDEISLYDGSLYKLAQPNLHHISFHNQTNELVTVRISNQDGSIEECIEVASEDWERLDFEDGETEVSYIQVLNFAPQEHFAADGQSPFFLQFMEDSEDEAEWEPGIELESD